MSLLTICPACQMGEHERHHRVVRAVSEGMMGGSECPCKGECQEDREGKRRQFLASLGLKSDHGSEDPDG